MNNMRNDVFAQMKNEDRQYGERNKNSKTLKAQDHQKRQKHRQDFRNYNAQDFDEMSDDYDNEE